MKFFAVVFALCVIFTASKPVAAQNCALCEYVVQAIESWVDSNATISEIEQYTLKLCALVPSFSAVCDAIAQEGIEEVISLIQQYENPQAVCTQLGVCTSLTGANCGICETVVNSVESWIASSATEAQIASSLSALCTLVPAFESTCDAIIAAGIPTVINWVEQNENATVVCGQLGVCGASKAVVKLGDNCDSCQTLIGTMEHWLEQNATESWIENELIATLCKFVPSFAKTCDAIFFYGVPDVVDWIETNEGPEVVCTQMGLCGSAAAKFLGKVAHSKNIKLGKLIQVN